MPQLVCLGSSIGAHLLTPGLRMTFALMATRPSITISPLSRAERADA